ncbi:MAG TPA: hypothetical protein VMZ22_09040 [Acidimicrobiales bacterium]|nr:hypothetical protein [Acidimicrobiales bacterium]
MSLLLLLSTFGLGLRHGVDWDHLAAITDITGAEYDRRRAGWLALLYAVGHGVAVMALGSLAIVAGERLPDWIDPVMERVVGVTLIVLAVMLARSLWRGGGTMSRGVLLYRGFSAVRARLRRMRRVEVDHLHPHGHDGSHVHDHPSPSPEEVEARAVITGHRHRHVHVVDVTRYTTGGAIAVGLLHGVGAETGTQAVVLVSASHVASTLGAIAVLAAFVMGIVATTGLLAIGAAFGWTSMSRGNRAFVVLTTVTTIVSLVVGVFFVTGHSGSLPGIAA